MGPPFSLTSETTGLAGGYDFKNYFWGLRRPLFSEPRTSSW